MNERPHRSRKRFRIAFWAVALLLFVGGAYLTHERAEHGRNCRVCAATYDHWKLKAYGIPIWWWDTDPVSTEDTKNYFDPYLGYSHDHEWTGGGYATYSLAMHRDGRSSYGPYPQHQRDLTRMGFRLVAASGIQDADKRRDYFERIIHQEDIDHYIRVRQTFDLIDDQIPKKPWAKWYPYKIWSSDMKEVEIPALVQGGKILEETAP